MAFSWVLLSRFKFQALWPRTGGKSNQLVFPDRFSFTFLQRFSLNICRGYPCVLAVSVLVVIVGFPVFGPPRENVYYISSMLFWKCLINNLYTISVTLFFVTICHHPPPPPAATAHHHLPPPPPTTTTYHHGPPPPMINISQKGRLVNKNNILNQISNSLSM